MDKTQATKIIQDIDGLRSKNIETDADTVIIQVQDSQDGPRNFRPKVLASLLENDAVFDAWVENNKFFVQMN